MKIKIQRGIMRRHCNNRSGTVLFTVIVLTMILSVIVISIMSTSVGQVKSSQFVIDELKAEYLAESEFQRFHQEMTLNGMNSLGSLGNVVLDTKTFSFESVDSSGTGPHDTMRLIFNLTF